MSAALESSGVLTSSRARVVRNVEWCKWLGLLCMLTDHVGVHVFGGGNALTEGVGSLAFPLFAVSFAEGLARAPLERGWAVLRRLLLWAAIAQVCVVSVRDIAPLTVLWTFVLGLAAYQAVAWRVGAGTIALVVGVAFIGAFAVEYAHVGVLFVVSLLHWCRSGSWKAAVCASVLLVLLQPFNGTHGALLSIPLVAVLSLAPRDLPRVRGVFYWAYAAQWPVLRVVRELVT